MTLKINWLPKHEDKVITMGKDDQPVADYYPPGATEPIVRPDNVPDPNAEPEKEVPEKEAPHSTPAKKK